MSRGAREAVSGNISKSMRDNYTSFGVDSYYTQVGSTYRNPHFPGVQLCIWSWLNHWWQHVGEPRRVPLQVLDLAAGSGEATIATLSWWSRATSPSPVSVPRPRSRVTPISINRADLREPPTVFAADPYTSEAYEARTNRPCHSLSFADIADGKFPWSQGNDSETTVPEDLITICSFALHLAEPSTLFSLLYSLSTRSRWLVVLAPHKKPEIKDSWGWTPWDLKGWCESEPGAKSETVFERVHCRVYQSTNYTPPIQTEGDA